MKQRQEVVTEDAGVVAITKGVMKSNDQKLLSLHLKHRLKKLLMKRSLETDGEVAEALVAGVVVVVVEIVHLQTDVTNVLKIRHILNVKIRKIDHSAHNATRMRSRLFVKKTKKLSNLYLN